MRHAKKIPAYKRLTTYGVGLALVCVAGLTIGGVMAGEQETPEVEFNMPKSPDTPGPSDEAPKTAEEGQARKDRTLGTTDVPETPERRSPATGEAVAIEPSTPAEKGSESPEEPTPGGTATATPKPGPPTPTDNPSETTKPDPKPQPEKPVYQFFIADDSEQNRTWCDKHPSGSVKVEIGTMYKSYYNDNDPAKAWASWKVSKEDTTCP